MPASVREWYELEGADTRLTVPTPGIEFYQDSLALLLSAEDEADVVKFWDETWKRPDLLPCLFVMGARGEVHFYVRLHGGDDPHVFDDVDPDRTDVPFSDFIRDTVQDIVKLREKARRVQE
jgi:hypothetical protein